MMRLTIRFALPFVVLALSAVLPVASAAQDQRDEQFYYPGAFNWEFIGTYPAAARLFNAFDYGHATLYEKLYTRPGTAQEALEREYRYLTTDLLVKPPRYAIAEEAVMPRYAKLAWRAKQMFDWAHILHRQIYDIYSDARIPPARKDSLIERVTDYYLSRKAYAFAPVPKSMSLMEGQYFSRTFRREYPKFNGLIWAYHWLQVGLYEPYIEAMAKPKAQVEAATKAGVDATVARFWSMLEDAPSRMPKVMPMTPAIAPQFTARHPRAAAIFDNLHMMHDIISDILAADTVPRDKKREVIYAQLAELQDTTRNVMSDDEWRNMAGMVGGVAVMGGRATGRLLAKAPPTPDPSPMGLEMMAKGTMGGKQAGSMRGMSEGGGMRHGGGMGGGQMQDGGHRQMSRGGRGMTDSAGAAKEVEMRRMMELHRRMMADSTIRERVMADPEMRKMMDWMERGQDSTSRKAARAEPAAPAHDH